MKRIFVGCVLALVVSLLSVPPVAQAQAPGQPYHPYSNGEMSQMGTWDAWGNAFNALTGKQKAEVVRRHISLCLEAFPMSEGQRTLVKDYTAKFVTEEAYSVTDPAKRAALQNEMKPAMDNAKAVLGDELTATIFFKKPPISVLDAVKNDPAFR